MKRQLVDLPAGNFLLTRVSFDGANNLPYLRLMNDSGEFFYARPGGSFTLNFDTSNKHCIGWYDMRTGECYRCETKREIDGKYEQCAECQRKTGFNPAFYNTTEISQQQAELNAKPHILYLAYFAPDTVKVGITHAGRNLARLLEQGARSAVILETFPSAGVARHYEAQIARLPGVCESVQLPRKIKLLTAPYDAATARKLLEQTVAKIEESLSVAFDGWEYLELSRHLLTDAQLDCTSLSEVTEPKISGNFAGMMGTLLVMRHGSRSVFLPLKKYIGNNVKISHQIEPLDLAPLQTSLF